MENTEVTIGAIESVGPGAIAIDFGTPAGFDARPGQFVKVTLDVDGGTESRFYTISSPDVTETFEITVEIDPEGTVGPRLTDLEPGDTIRLSGPFGNAYYEGEPRVLVLAGGPGVGPAVGIAERALAEGGDAAIVYRDGTPIHRERLAALEDRGVVVRLLAPDEPLDDAVAGITGNGEQEGERSQVFIYGFADFLDAATSAVAAAGGDPGAAKVENFG